MEARFEDGLSHNANSNKPLLAQPETQLAPNLSGIGGYPDLEQIVPMLEVIGETYGKERHLTE
jgi:hypothetical protein